ncbi:MAG: hypothetical protein CMP08_07745 [Xanthomonadales bacterium]|nr:hypothetical protein [Xanthomonadales bacterium]|tara:strand:+ start:334 stop:576 length:243 start_codon:yes stop_codon:yes gene_type:complete
MRAGTQQVVVQSLNTPLGGWCPATECRDEAFGDGFLAHSLGVRVTDCPYGRVRFRTPTDEPNPRIAFWQLGWLKAAQRRV